MEKKIVTPLTVQKARELRAGDSVLISGVLYTARDAAHKRLCELIRRGEDMPFELKDAVIYFVGPTPAPPGRPIGSAGPTTSGRMDAYSPLLIAHGLTGMIGKGSRNSAVVDAMRRFGCVYFGAVGGCGALLSHCITRSEIIAYEDLGPEAVRRLEVRDLPAVVIIDSLGNDLYESGRRAYLESLPRDM